MIKQKYLDRRQFNSPPPPNTAIKRFNSTVSARVNTSEVEELERLLNQRYGGRKLPMNSISFVIRNAIKAKARELREYLNRA